MRWFAALLLASVAGSACASDADGRHAVILVYHHVSAETPPSTSVTPERFEAHLEWLADNGYRVWPVEKVLAAVIDGAEPVPDDVVAITFDDAYQSVYDEARPRLERRDWPYTVFVNTDAIDAGHRPYMDWEALRELADRGVGIGNHSAAHGHMAAPAEGESAADWRRRVRDDLTRSHQRISDQIGRAPTLFAYPYGEDSPALADLVDDRYDYALVQRSGAVGPLTDPHAVPRFPMATGFAELDRLATAVDSRPLPVTETAVAEDDARGDIDWVRLTLADGGYRADALSCFSGGGSRLDFERESADPLTIRIGVDGVGSPGRNKVNCTAPAADGSGDFYWHAFQWRIEP
jgi:peptidoglycan/xylan/chitin deacetylase (PgdA/CDA1 family)